MDADSYLGYAEKLVQRVSSTREQNSRLARTVANAVSKKNTVGKHVKEVIPTVLIINHRLHKLKTFSLEYLYVV